MSQLENIIADYKKEVPEKARHEISFVAGIAALANWLADSHETEWGHRLDKLMVEVGDYDGENAKADAPPSNT